jgi:acetyl-CoA carboxylase biotin carboxylase subunit
MEKYILEPRHIEIQVARDKFGNAVHLYERECSIQRRHQKVIEESPSIAIDDSIREKMGQAAIMALNAVNYHTVATVEFLLDKDKNFYFLEVNTRIQVEHPVTEMVTGIDLVKLQINLAYGNEIGLVQSDIKQNGHAIETRIYAEDAENNFLPTGGKVLHFDELNNPGIRVDSGIKIGDSISPYYDPIMSKIICYGSNRNEAISKSIYALKNYNLLGVKTSIPYLINILDDEDFRKGNTTTDFISLRNEKLLNFKDNKNHALSIVDLLESKTKSKSNNLKNEYSSPWQEIGAWEID